MISFKPMGSRLLSKLQMTKNLLLIKASKMYYEQLNNGSEINCNILLIGRLTISILDIN